MESPQRISPSAVPLVVALAFAALAALPGPGAAQQAPSKPVVGSSTADQPPVAEVVLLVEDWGTREELEPVAAGGTLRLTVGQQVRLRAQALPRGQNRSPRYPSARFRLTSGQRRVDLSKANEETGRVLVRGVRTDDPSGAPTVLRFEVLTPLNAPPEVLTDTIQIVVADATPTPLPETPGGSGVTLFEHDGYRGRSELFAPGEYSDLRRHNIGNDRASSVRVDRDCLVELYSGGGFGGTRAMLNHDLANLADSPVGNDSVSSLRVTCGNTSPPSSSGPGATLYSETGFRGRSERFPRDAASLGGSLIGDDQVRSVELDPGCVAVLYDGAGFRGDSTELRGSESDLRGTRIGLDRTSSIRVRCDG